MGEHERIRKICRTLAGLSTSYWRTQGDEFSCEYEGLKFDIKLTRGEDMHYLDGAQIIGEGEHAQTVVNMPIPMTKYDVSLQIFDTGTGVLIESHRDTESVQLEQDLPQLDLQNPRLIALYLKLRNRDRQERERKTQERVEEARARLEKIID